MPHNGAISDRDSVVLGREKVKWSSFQIVIQQPHRIYKMCKLRVLSWNVGTMRRRASLVVETIRLRHIDICSRRTPRGGGLVSRRFI